jgi:hypothetical protein
MEIRNKNLSTKIILDQKQIELSQMPMQIIIIPILKVKNQIILGIPILSLTEL